MTLTDLHKLVRLMGRYFETLKFHFLHSTDKVIYGNLEQITKHCSNIQHMEFQVPIFRNEFISLLKSIFNNLSTLKIDVKQHSEVNPDFDLTVLLPKLKHVDPGPLLINCLEKPWPSLESFGYKRYDRLLRKSGEKFFALNPHLRFFDLSFEMADLKNAVDQFPNIELHLNLSVQYKFLHTSDQLIHLKRLSNLTELKFCTFLIYNSLELMPYLIGLSNLKKLQIIFSDSI